MIKEHPTDSKKATDMDRASVANRHWARDLHPDHANPENHNGPLVAPGAPWVIGSGRMMTPTQMWRTCRIPMTKAE